MTCLHRTCLAALFTLLCLPTHAESLRCNGRSAAEGDSRITVLHHCGEPLLKDSFCAPVYYTQTLQPVPPLFANYMLPCQQVDQWLYDRGPGNFMATVRFQFGVVQSIKYGNGPQ